MPARPLLRGMAQKVTRAAPAPEGTTDLPAIVEIRTRVVVDGDDAVEVRFANGARLRYREREADIEERWVAPDGTVEDPAVTHTRTAEVGAEALALRTVGEYLSFDDRRRAEFVWGAENTAALLGE